MCQRDLRLIRTPPVCTVVVYIRSLNMVPVQHRQSRITPLTVSCPVFTQCIGLFSGNPIIVLGAWPCDSSSNTRIKPRVVTSTGTSKTDLAKCLVPSAALMRSSQSGQPGARLTIPLWTSEPWRRGTCNFPRDATSRASSYRCSSCLPDF